MLNPRLNVYRVEWLDVVFANRNQNYGAYELRKNYDKTLIKALFIASSLFITAVGAPFIYSKLHKAASSQFDDQTGTICTLTAVPTYRPPVKPVEPAAPLPKSPSVPTTKFVTPHVVPVDQVTETIATMTELQETAIGSQTVEGPSASNSMNTLEVGPTGGGTEGTAPSAEEVQSWESVEKAPAFPGGVEAFSKYLRKNLRYPSEAVEAEVSGKVFVSFVVEKNGELSDIQVLKGVGFGCDEEAVRVLKLCPFWTPGFQNNHPVRVRYTMPIAFALTSN